MKSEKEKVLAGELYDAKDSELVANRRRVRLLTKRLNDTRDDDVELRRKLLQELT